MPTVPAGTIVLLGEPASNHIAFRCIGLPGVEPSPRRSTQRPSRVESSGHALPSSALPPRAFTNPTHAVAPEASGPRTSPPHETRSPPSLPPRSPARRHAPLSASSRHVHKIRPVPRLRATFTAPKPRSAVALRDLRRAWASRDPSSGLARPRVGLREAPPRPRPLVREALTGPRARATCRRFARWRLPFGRGARSFEAPSYSRRAHPRACEPSGGACMSDRCRDEPPEARLHARPRPDEALRGPPARKTRARGGL